jgi:hypothetical protein
MMKKLVRHWPLLLAALLLLCCVFALWRFWTVSNLLTSQQAAQRWKGTGERDFAQLSFFMPEQQKLSLDKLYAFRGEMIRKMKDASFDVEKEKGLYTDAWSAAGSVKVSCGRQSGEVQALAVGGNFFAFHPLRLLSGNYLSPNDIMGDRVLLDRETAWLLFGAVDLAGMSFSVNGEPFVVAGVYEHERDAFSKAAYGEGMSVYMSYDSFVRLFPEDTGVTCYEIVMAEPVKGFARSAAAEKFPIKKAELAENSYRFDTDRLLKLLKNGMERSMRMGTAVFPYWENAARAAEDRAAFWLACAAVTGALPAALLLYWAIRLAVIGKRKMEDEVLPETKKRTKEFVRERSRRRWERKHPDEF